MDFTAPEKKIYKYKVGRVRSRLDNHRLEKQDSHLHQSETGNYKFQIKASNRDGVWNDYETSLAIEVLPPPWKSWWAYTLYGLTFLALLFGARRNIIQRERLASKLNLNIWSLKKLRK
jgi:hypothetical protein